MEMPWYGWIFSGLAVWLTGFIAGRGSGAMWSIQQQAQAQAKMMQIPGLPPGMPGPGRQ